MIVWPARLLPLLVLAAAGFLALPAAAGVRHGIALPNKPQVERTLNVCLNGEQPDCYKSVGAALAVNETSNTRVLVYCGHYQGDTADLFAASNFVLEGVPCPNGRLPVLDANGKSLRHMGAYPWLGKDRAVGLWIENVELRGNHVAGNGTPVRVGGSGEVMFKNVVIDDNDDGILINSDFDGAVYVVDSVFRNNGYGRTARTHHIYNSCETGCLLVVLDSFFGKVVQGGNHVRVRGDLIAVGNMFVDEPDADSSRMINTSPEACRLKSPAAPPPCLVAENYMLKSHDSRNAQFINVGTSPDNNIAPIGMVVRDNVVMSLRMPALLVGNVQPNATVVVRGNVMVVKDKTRCTSTGLRCLVSVVDKNTTLDGNVVSDDPGDIPTLFQRRDKTN